MNFSNRLPPPPSRLAIESCGCIQNYMRCYVRTCRIAPQQKLWPWVDMGVHTNPPSWWSSSLLMSLAIRIGLGLKIPCIWIFPTNMFLFSCGLAASPCVHTRVCSSPYLQVPLPLSRASIANVLNFSRKIFPVLQHSCILYVPRSVNLRFYTSAELGTINLSSKGSPAQPTSDESVTMQRANNLTYV